MAMFRIFRSQFRQGVTIFQSAVNTKLSNFPGVCRVRASQSTLFGKKTLATLSGFLNDKDFVKGFEDLSELQSADENVRKIFSLGNASQKEKRKVLHSELIKNCQSSSERKIAKMTISMENLKEHLERTRNKDKHNKVYLQWLTDQRAKKLKTLMLSNFERYIELIKELNIEPLPSTHSKYVKYKFRRFKIGVEMREKRSQAVRKMPSLASKSSKN